MYVYQILENNTFKLGPCALFYKLLEVTLNMAKIYEFIRSYK